MGKYAWIFSLAVAHLYLHSAPAHAADTHAYQQTDPRCDASHTNVAHVVALEQIYVYNRFGAFNPGGMLYALRRDVVVSDDDGGDGGSELADLGLYDGAPIPAHYRPGQEVTDKALAGHVRLRPEKRPRPIVLRVNEGDCLKVVFTNLLSPDRDGEEHVIDPETGREISIDSDEPATRTASMHVNGLELIGSIESDGTNVGFNESSLAAPGETRTYIWAARKEGGYLLHSMAAAAGGEGDGGQLGLGLFGSVNVEPAGSTWYRSQVTGSQLQAATEGRTKQRNTPVIDYAARTADGVPILDMLMEVSDDPDAGKELVHSDLNAIVDVSKHGEHCEIKPNPGSSCGEPFREFTVIFHDEITAVQAFAELEKEESPLGALKDGMGINYGAAGLGAMVVANRGREGPAKDCVECKLEEFFLTSWAMGDPALVIERDENNQPVRALYEDDPSNVHHSYLGDAVRFRNLHAGPKETHVFHLHAHQWLQDWHDPESVYLDSQTISPGASFTYEVHYGGSGNRNLTPGDSIFHCHLYPHFAQGMWELWRTHDVFEAGTRDRWLPDGDIAGGTPNPAVVPLPGAPLPPLPTSGFEGYPFYIAGIAGHRPPQAPLDIDPDAYAEESDRTLMRHVVQGGERELGEDLFGEESGEPKDLEKKYFDATIAEDDPLGQANRIAVRVREQNDSKELLLLAAKLTKADIRKLPLDGTPEEQTAMAFHAGDRAEAVTRLSPYGVEEKGYPTCLPNGDCDQADDPERRVLFQVNGLAPKPGAPYADPCPERFYLGRPNDAYKDPSKWVELPPERRYRATYLQFDMPVNKHGWHDPQARIITLEQDAKATLDHTRPAEPFFFRANSGECVVFVATNLIPSNLNLDDFQVFTPTDTIGQHIHLVKFDVTASDGSGNGWNYEDGTLSPDEIRERIIAGNAFKGKVELKPLTHRLFRDGGALVNDPRGVCPAELPLDPIEAEKVFHDHPWCGAQSTIQRWWADPLLNLEGKDKTIRTVFTHDHFGPSSHQQHGLYAALVIEPNGSSWQTLAGNTFGGQDEKGDPIRTVGRDDGGPTSYAANIVTKDENGEPKGQREYNLAVADFALLYTAPPANLPISPPGRLDHDLPQMVFNSPIPRPEGISVSDPGGQLMNYRNEPIPGRVGQANDEGKWSLRAYVPASTQVEACRSRLGVDLPPDDPERAPELTLCLAQDDDKRQICEERVVKMRCDPSDLANVFSSVTHVSEDEEIRAAITRDDLAYDTRRIFLDNYLKRDCVDGTAYLCAEPTGLRRDGDPATPLLGAKEGDRVQVRLIQGAQEENHIFFMNNAKWLAVPGSQNSGYRAAQHIGISEHFEFEIDLENPSPQLDQDQLYGTTATDNLWDGQWGLLRVVGSDRAAEVKLAALPGSLGKDELINVLPLVCNAATPKRHFEVEAWRLGDLNGRKGLAYHARRGLDDPNATIYVLADEVGLIRSGHKAPEPLVLRARAGECIEVLLTNRLDAAPEDLRDPANWSWNMMPPIADGLNFNDVRASRALGLHAQLVAGNPANDDGSAVGLNRSTLAYPCDKAESAETCGSDVDPADGTPPDGSYTFDNTAMYRWYAGEWTKPANQGGPRLTPIEFGAIGLQNFGDVIKGASHGTIGALVIEPEDATWETDCEIMQEAGLDQAERRDCLNAAATVTAGGESFREFVLIYQNDASLRYRSEALANLRNGDDAEDSGQKAFNYRFEPFWTRLDANPAADPETMMAYDYTNVLSSKPEHGHGDPSTPLFTAKAGTPVRFRLVEPAGHPRNGAFTLSGHDWVTYPWTDRSARQVANPPPGDAQNRSGVVNGMGPGRHANVLLESAGGRGRIPGDYLYRTPVGFAFGGGQWGIMRVFDAKDCDGGARTVRDPHTGRIRVCE
ncbi:MAG: multicopper oxidase domain-containing protein [Alphaproteobacteria bacterium]